MGRRGAGLKRWREWGSNLRTALHTMNLCLRNILGKSHSISLEKTLRELNAPGITYLSVIEDQKSKGVRQQIGLTKNAKKTEGLIELLQTSFDNAC